MEIFDILQSAPEELAFCFKLKYNEMWIFLKHRIEKNFKMHFSQIFRAPHLPSSCTYHETKRKIQVHVNKYDILCTSDTVLRQIVQSSLMKAFIAFCRYNLNGCLQKIRQVMFFFYLKQNCLLDFPLPKAMFSCKEFK